MSRKQHLPLEKLYVYILQHYKEYGLDLLYT